MRDLTANYAALAGILFFVGRLQVFPSLGEAFLAGLLAGVTVAVALIGADTLFHREPKATTSARSLASKPLPPQHPEA